MKCSKCGREFEGSFCPKCGKKNSDIAAQTINKADDKRSSRKMTYFWLAIIIIVAANLLCAAYFFNGGSIEAIRGRDNTTVTPTIEWAKLELKDTLPEPPSMNGYVYQNTNERLRVSLNGVSVEEYAAYVTTCVNAGFTIDAETSEYSYSAYNADGYFVSVKSLSGGMSVELQAPVKMGAISWPDSIIGSLLPKPDSLVGSFDYNDDEGFRVYIADISKANYADYVEKSIDNGFSVNYVKGENYYFASNKTGYSIRLEYKADDIMVVQAKAPKNSADTLIAATTAEPSYETASEAASLPTDAQPAEAFAASTVEPTAQPTPSVTSNAAENDVQKNSTVVVNGVDYKIDNADDEYRISLSINGENILEVLVKSPQSIQVVSDVPAQVQATVSPSELPDTVSATAPANVHD